MINQIEQLGFIIGGSLSDGLQMRIQSQVPLTELKAGKFVCISSGLDIYFCLITNLKLEVTNPEVMHFPPSTGETLLKAIIQQNNTYAVAQLKPLLSFNNQKLAPVKTLPSHFSPVIKATKQDIIKVFGEETKNNQYFSVGSPIDMEDALVCMNLDKLTERSNGIFGKTGTGKTFLTRLLLAGLISKNMAVSLIFDMHSEYGLQARQEKAGAGFVKGLKTLFGSKVALFTLDPQSTKNRGGSPDCDLIITYESIAVEDIISLDTELNLHATAYEAAYLLTAKYKKNWLGVLFDHQDNLKELASEVGAHPESLAALFRKLRAIQRLPFVRPSAPNSSGYSKTDCIDDIIGYIDREISVIIEFGNYSSSFSYLLLANIITRRIHQLYIEKTEKFLGSNKSEQEPKKLLIVIEEAHKFLNTQAARQTTFGIIAREMRKYYVSLMVIDQRPSGIDPEILSQIGTKLIAQLSDEKDIQAILTGVSHAQELKTVLAGLETKEQALLLGHAVTMPIVVQTRAYDEKFYKDIAPTEQTKTTAEITQELY